MVADINGTTLWCPVCDMTKEIEKDEPDQRE
jgi:hypothetical protein